MVDISDLAGQKVAVKAQKLIGSGTKQVLLEESKTLDAVKIVDVVATISDVSETVKTGKVIVQGTVHKQIFYIGTDDLEHHVAEDLTFSELVDVTPVDPDEPAEEGMTAQDHSTIENLVFEFDPDTKVLTQKVVVLLDVRVTEEEQLNVALDPYGTWIKTEVVVGEGEKQKFIEETKTLEAIKIVDIVPTITTIKSIVKNGKVIVQGIVHKQIFFVGTDDLVHHISEDLPFSDLVEVTPLDPDYPVVEGMNQQDHSEVENLVWEFDPDTRTLVQKVILKLAVKVTETDQLPVALDPYGTWIKTEVVIGHGTKQKLIELSETLEAVKIMDIDARIDEVSSIVKNGKVIVQGVVKKQIFYVGNDALIHHVSQTVPFSEMVEVVPLNPDVPVREGMNQQDHSTIENLVWEFDPDTSTLTEKIIIKLDVKVTETDQIRVADP